MARHTMVRHTMAGYLESVVTAFWSFLTVLAFTACGSLEKEIVIPQPEYDRQLVVECYLEAGKPYQMLLTESVEYLANPQVPTGTPIPSPVPIVQDASVTILYQNQTDALSFKPVIDTAARKGYNYSLDKAVSGDMNTEYTLEVTDPKGRKVTGKTRFLPFVPIKSLDWSFNDENKAYLTIRFDDDPATVDYYRFLVTRDSLSGDTESNFAFEDRFATNNEITLGTGYDYKEGDTLFVTLFHIDQAYHDFLESANDAAGANGNPFAQPSQVKSTVTGGIGVFTTLVYDRRRIVIEKK